MCLLLVWLLCDYLSVACWLRVDCLFNCCLIVVLIHGWLLCWLRLWIAVWLCRACLFDSLLMFAFVCLIGCWLPVDCIVDCLLIPCWWMVDCLLIVCLIVGGLRFGCLFIAFCYWMFDCCLIACSIECCLIVDCVMLIVCYVLLCSIGVGLFVACIFEFVLVITVWLLVCLMCLIACWMPFDCFFECCCLLFDGYVVCCFSIAGFDCVVHCFLIAMLVAWGLLCCFIVDCLFDCVFPDGVMIALLTDWLIDCWLSVLFDCWLRFYVLLCWLRVWLVFACFCLRVVLLVAWLIAYLITYLVASSFVFWWRLLVWLSHSRDVVLNMRVFVYLCVCDVIACCWLLFDCVFDCVFIYLLLIAVLTACLFAVWIACLITFWLFVRLRVECLFDCV